MIKYVFILVLTIGAVSHIITPDSTYSERENRMLAQKPELSPGTVSDKSFMLSAEAYINDQFPLRYFFVSLKAYCEKALGKTENNGVYFGRGVLAEKTGRPDYAVIDKNITAINSFITDNDTAEIYLALIPAVNGIWRDKLPENAPDYNQERLISYINTQIHGARVIDIYSALYAKRDEDIYFSTDHHWNAKGAYYGYAAVVSAMGFAPEELGEPVVVSNSFYGSAYAKSAAVWYKPDIIEIYRAPDNAVNINRDGGPPEEMPVYIETELHKRNQYAYFLGGNTPLRVIVTKNADLPKILILRDSYADIQTPYFIPHFSEIHLVDLRYFREDIGDYMRECGINAVLFSYCVNTFLNEIY